MIFFKKGFPSYLQFDSKDCGPTCLQILCKYWGQYYDIEHLREITGARKEGTSVYDLVKGLEQLNIKSLILQTSYKKLHSDVPLPCIIHWKANHFIVVYKITKKYVYVSDPAIGLVKYSKREFTKGWLGHIKEHNAWKKGICIAVEPTAEFNKSQSNPNRQTNYLDSLSYILTYIKPYKKNVLQIFGVLLILTFINILFPIITQSIIDVGIVSQDLSFIGLMLISAVILGLSSSLGTWVQQSINLHFSVRIKVSMLSDFLISLFKLPLSFFENRLMGDLFQRSYDYDRIELNL